jgi:hypothetical protein
MPQSGNNSGNRTQTPSRERTEARRDSAEARREENLDDLNEFNKRLREINRDTELSERERIAARKKLLAGRKQSERDRANNIAPLGDDPPELYEAKPVQNASLPIKLPNGDFLHATYQSTPKYEGDITQRPFSLPYKQPTKETGPTLDLSEKLGSQQPFDPFNPLKPADTPKASSDKSKPTPAR